MRLSLPSLAVMAFASQALACVDFHAYFTNNNYIVADLSDNGKITCAFDASVDGSGANSTALQCDSGYSATFTWYGTGAVLDYNTPAGDIGSFSTVVTTIATSPNFINLYSAQVWGC